MTMESKNRIEEAVAALERIQTNLAGIASRSDAERRRDLIRLRRELAIQYAELNTLVEAWIEESKRPELRGQHRERFSRMRSAAAMHQANWPAVSLDPSSPEFQASAARVREANRTYVEWIRSIVAGADHPST